ncbi:MAG: BMP family ABC transporter substrate-binding protein [Candidatus Hodarchaeota archaeon]
MKRLLIGYLPVLLLLFCVNSADIGIGNISESVSNIAVILDASTCYDENFLEDVLNGFDAINQTYNISYNVFRLSNYKVTNRTHYRATYEYYNSTSNDTIITNHTQLARILIESNKFDLIAFIGYELRQIGNSETPLTELYPDMKFLFYDLAGVVSSDGEDDKRNNVFRVSFLEEEVGYIAGILATETITPFPSQISAVGIKPKWFRGEPRSNKLIAGFQAGILRQIAETKIDISYIGYYTNYTEAKTLGTRLESDGYELAFAALQNENTLGILDGFLNNVITVDSNRSLITGNRPFGSIVKNNTKTLLTTFEILNQSATFGGSLEFGFQDGVFYPDGWGNDASIDNAMEQIYQDLVVDKISLPNDIIDAQNTPGFEIITGFNILLLLSIIVRKRRE